MVESLKELNRICQKPRYREVGNFMVRYFLRDAALPITWLLLHTNISANQVTTFALGTGLFGLLCLSFSAGSAFLSGMIFLQIWYLLDHVDGQIARYRKTVSLTGRFYDFLMHHFIHGLFFLPLGYYLYSMEQSLGYLSWAILLCIGVIFLNLLHDIKYKTFFERLTTLPALRIQKITPSASQPSRGNWQRKAFQLAHKLIEMHVLMNIFTAGAILEFFFFRNSSFRTILFIFYGLLIPPFVLMKIMHWIKSKKIDADYSALIQEIDHA